MTDRLGVQRDDIARVVRLLSDGDEYHELDPADAIETGEAMIRAGRELQTTQATLADDGQLTLAEGSDDGTESLNEMYDRLEDAPDDRQEIGDVVNPDDPLKW